MAKIRVVYVTTSPYKTEESKIFVRDCALSDGTPVDTVFQFDIVAAPVPIKEPLDVDLELMVTAEVLDAYEQLKVPCIVEHAGLIFQDYADKSYPGGLTKAMWDRLGDRFIEETKSAKRPAIAKAVVAYCDGMTVHTFRGERTGTIAEKPKGTRNFYWDTVFIPDDPAGKGAGRTYAEIVDDPALGLPYKVRELSQSTLAMKEFLAYRREHEPDLWR